jgi:hypothetical protein
MKFTVIGYPLESGYPYGGVVLRRGIRDFVDASHFAVGALMGHDFQLVQIDDETSQIITIKEH